MSKRSKQTNLRPDSGAQMTLFQNFTFFVTLLIILQLPLVLSTYNVLLVLIPNFRSYFLKKSVFIPNTPNLNLFSSNCLTFLNAFTQVFSQHYFLYFIFSEMKTPLCFDHIFLDSNVRTE